MKVRLLIILSLILFSCDSGGGGAVHGCSDSEACNYNPQTTVDNNTCEYSDVNYDCDGNCIFEVGCTCSDCPLIIGDWVGITEDYDFQHPGCEPYDDFIGQDASGRTFTFEDDCTYSEIYDYPDEYGEGEGIFICNSNMITVCNDNTGCITAVYTFADDDTDTFNAVWTQTEDDCTYSVSLDLEREVIEMPGCTDYMACNYDANATVNDGSCSYQEENYDCAGNCIVELDCAGDCGGSAEFDDCGVCDGDTINQCGSCDYVYLWGVCYNIQETTTLSPLTHLTGEIPPEIGKLTNLTYLHLNSNELTGEIPPEIGNLTNLTHLYLYENYLTGEIPSEIRYLTNLRELYLNNNHLTGEIPPEIGYLTNLWFLYLYDNQLTGEIPSEIGNLTNLINLSLNSNQLSGEIPEEFCNQGDSTPDVGNNQLCPPYPTCIFQWDIDSQDTSECPEE